MNQTAGMFCYMQIRSFKNHFYPSLFWKGGYQSQGTGCFLCILFQLHHHKSHWNFNDSIVKLPQRRKLSRATSSHNIVLVLLWHDNLLFYKCWQVRGERSTTHGKSVEGKRNLEWHFPFSFPIHRLLSGFFLQFPWLPAQPLRISHVSHGFRAPWNCKRIVDKDRKSTSFTTGKKAREVSLQDAPCQREAPFTALGWK